MSADDSSATALGPWDPVVDTLRAWDPKWAETCVKMTIDPWASGVLPRKFVNWSASA